MINCSRLECENDNRIGSVDLDCGRRNDAPPLYDLASDVIAELLRRIRHDLAPARFDVGAHLLAFCQSGCDLSMESPDYGPGRARAHGDTVPGPRFESRIA